MFNLTKPEFHKKGWGYELWLVNDNKYCGKILHFNAGKMCSLHYHKIKHEHFYIFSGIFQIILAGNYGDVINDIEKRYLYPGDVLEIPPLLVHQIVSLSEGEIIEISTQHFENDSYRLTRGD